MKIVKIEEPDMILKMRLSYKEYEKLCIAVDKFKLQRNDFFIKAIEEKIQNTIDENHV